MVLTSAERRKIILQKKREAEKNNSPDTPKNRIKKRKSDTKIQQETIKSVNYCRCCFVALSNIDLQKTIDDVFLAFWDITKIALESAPNADFICKNCFQMIFNYYEFKGLAIVRQQKFKEMLKTGGDFGEINKLSLPSDFWEELKEEQQSQQVIQQVFESQRNSCEEEQQNQEVFESQQNSSVFQFEEQNVKEEPYEYEVIEENPMEQKVFPDAKESFNSSNKKTSEEIFLPAIKGSKSDQNLNNIEDQLLDVTPNIVLVSKKKTKSGIKVDSKDLVAKAHNQLKQLKLLGTKEFRECSVCNKTYKNLSLHMKTHEKNEGRLKSKTQEKKVTCADCGIRLNSNALVKHVRQVHLKVRDAICDYCGLSYFDKHALLPHLKTHLPKMKCELCEYSTAFEKRLDYHFKTQHLGQAKRKKIQKPVIKNLPCPECGILCRNEFCLIAHMERMHKKIKNNKCDFCDKSFYSRTELRSHQDNNHLPKNVVCELCGDKFGNNRMLSRHKRTHLEAIFECDNCEKKFKLKEPLRDHVNRMHLQEKANKCTYADCNREFYHIAQLRTHIRSIHLGIKFNCVLPGCSSAFGRQDALKYHAIHTHKLKGEELEDFLKKMIEQRKQMRKEGKL